MPRKSGNPARGRGSKPRSGGRGGRGGSQRSYEKYDAARPESAIDTPQGSEDDSEDGKRRRP